MPSRPSNLNRCASFLFFAAVDVHSQLDELRALDELNRQVEAQYVDQVARAEQMLAQVRSAISEITRRRAEAEEAAIGASS